MKENYQYPLDYTWRQEELVVVMKLWNLVEAAYEKGIPLAEFQAGYQAFKKVVPSIGEEKRLGKEFQQESGYSLYRVVQASKTTTRKILKMEAKS